MSNMFTMGICHRFPAVYGIFTIGVIHSLNRTLNPPNYCHIMATSDPLIGEQIECTKFVWATRAPNVKFRFYDANLYCRKTAVIIWKANPLCTLMGVHPSQHDVLFLCPFGDSRSTSCHRSPLWGLPERHRNVSSEDYPRSRLPKKRAIPQ